MNIQSKRELEVTRKKLHGLEELYEKTRLASSANDYAAQLTLRSLRRTVNQLKEEIARFEARDQTAATKQ